MAACGAERMLASPRHGPHFLRARLVERSGSSSGDWLTQGRGRLRWGLGSTAATLG